MKQQMFNFIKLVNPHLKSILDIKSVGHNGDEKLIKEYIVGCLIAVPDTSISIYNLYGEKKATCIVNAEEFEKWIKKENAIKWL